MGLIINKPIQVMMPELLDHLEIENTAPELENMPVLLGGPLQKNQGMVIHNSETPWKTSIQLAESIFLTTSTDILEKIGSDSGPEQSLVTLGYSSWGSGQLEQEIVNNNWLTVPADESIIFETPTNERWQAAAQLLGFDINLMSNVSGNA